MNLHFAYTITYLKLAFPNQQLKKWLLAQKGKKGNKHEQPSSSWMVKTASCVCQLKNNKPPANTKKPLHKQHTPQKQDWIVKITGRHYGFYLRIFVTTEKQKQEHCCSQFFWSLLGICDDCSTGKTECLWMLKKFLMSFLK